MNVCKFPNDYIIIVPACSLQMRNPHQFKNGLQIGAFGNEKFGLIT